MKKNLLGINWEISRNCNLKCVYCRVNDGKKFGDLSTNQCKKIINALNALNYEHIQFTGGEPLFRQDFWEIASYIHKLGIKTSLVTNATLIKNSDLELFNKYIYIVAISLDSLDDEHNKLLGRPSHKIIANKIRQLVKQGLHVKISATLTRINRNGVADLLEFVKSTGVEEIKINDFVADGQTLVCEKKLELERPLLKDVGSLSSIVKQKLGEKTKYQKFFRCECSSNGLFITHSGDLYPCVELSYTNKYFCLGNMLKDNFGEMLLTNNRFSQQIKKGDLCRYSFLSSQRFSSCLNRGHCPKSLFNYMKNAKQD
ncbi:MAG: radical SAM/SPASM domain-containing protein [Patescibacteria group bacterium]